MQRRLSYNVELLRLLGGKDRKKVLLFLLKQKSGVVVSQIARETNMEVGIAGYVVDSLYQGGILSRKDKDGKKISCYRIPKKTAKAIAAKLRVLAELFEDRVE